MNKIRHFEISWVKGNTILTVSKGNKRIFDRYSNIQTV